MAIHSLPFVLPRVRDEELEFRKYLNLLLALVDRRKNSEFVCARPFEATIDPSTACQLACPICEVGNGTIRRERAFLSLEVHARFVSELADDLFIAWYFSTGEPLLNKRLPEIVAQVRGKEVFPILSTNLSLPLSDERLDELLNCGFGIISVSLDGASPGTYRRYRVKGDHALVVENLRRLILRKRLLGLEFPLLEWRFLVFRHNQDEIVHARRLAGEWGLDLFELFPGYAPPDANEGEVQSALSPDLSVPASGPALDRGRMRRDSALRRHIQDGSGTVSPPGGGPVLLHQKCDWLYFGAMLFPSGSIGPCCLSNNAPDDFGMLSERAHFEREWNNDKFRQARRSFTRREPNNLVCSRCPNHDAQDYQFQMTLRAILQNSPDWVLRVLAAAPDAFFFDIDFELSPVELRALRELGPRVAGPSRQVLRRLERAGRRHPGAGDTIRAWQELLDAGPGAGSPP